MSTMINHEHIMVCLWNDTWRRIVNYARWLVSSPKHVPQYVHDSVANVSHLLEVNGRVQRWIKKCESQCLEKKILGSFQLLSFIPELQLAMFIRILSYHLWRNSRSSQSFPRKRDTRRGDIHWTRQATNFFRVCFKIIEHEREIKRAPQTYSYTCKANGCNQWRLIIIFF